MFHQSATLFYYESCLSGSSFEAAVLPPVSWRQEEVLFRFGLLFPYSTCITCLDISSLWDVAWANVYCSQLREAVRHNKTCQLQYMSMQRPFCPVFFPCKSVMLIIPGNLFHTLSKDTFSHRSVITAYSQAIMHSACVWKHLGVFLPIILATSLTI